MSVAAALSPVTKYHWLAVATGYLPTCRIADAAAAPPRYVAWAENRLNNPRFAQRHTFDNRAQTVELRHDAPRELREVIVDIFFECDAGPNNLRDSLCRSLRLAGKTDVWSIDDLRAALTKCAWFEVYDAIEGMASTLGDLDQKWGGSRAATFEKELNDYFERRHIGWVLHAGMLSARGPAALEQAVHDAIETQGSTTAARELLESLRDLSRRPQPDLTGAIQHAMASLECLARMRTLVEWLAAALRDCFGKVRRPATAPKLTSMATDIFLVAAICTLTSACGGSAESACELGQKKLDECAVDLARGSTLEALVRSPWVISDECTAQDKCVGGCLERASCAAIIYLAAPDSTDPNEPVPPDTDTFRACVFACVSQ